MICKQHYEVRGGPHLIVEELTRTVHSLQQNLAHGINLPEVTYHRQT